MPYKDLFKYNEVREDPWSSLQEFTNARIALGRTGNSLPLKKSLQFKLAHAHARDAVHSALKIDDLGNQLQNLHIPFYTLHSKALNRSEYLQRPDLGRTLDDASKKQLAELNGDGFDIAIVWADGLSATAINRHALTVSQMLLQSLEKEKFSVAPVALVQQARVAIGDDIGMLLKAKIVLVLIGERPGLSSPDSMGAYLTYNPKSGLTDEARNCISNIRPEGLDYIPACEKILYLIKESMRLQLSGVSLKDNALLLTDNNL